ncbi:ABC-2 type transport system ATP-binding protein [Hypnocyclicus thermotrophus]|uniref:ABC-2 type transport system ATP-binding protein n=1 Tax=Hypnocyclicus thermotrophus TaxID=1627895 RepID=A0AA46DYE3_9FUSO|nr:ABC transporter ATP-binding protein [Hypnocyclicus thermotrophus]TDT69799.1 ABC-2 type transport system ATP-binding protein [Hypnocyclicus thermotrophus]
MILKVENLTKIYKEKDIFKNLKGKKYSLGIKDISFSVNEGEIFSIIGLNGAGKTTLLKCILGLLEYDSGKIEIFGENMLINKNKKYIGYLPEISYYPKDLKLIDIMNFYGYLYELAGSELKYRIDEVLDRFDIKQYKNKRLEEFSKGMLQKVGLAQSLMNKPKLLFWDEPMSGLDPIARKKVIDIIKELKEKGTTVFLNTHILDDIEKIGERIIIINKGKIVEEINIKKDKIQNLEEYFIEKIKGDSNEK